MRTIIELPDEQVAALAALCAREQISRAEAIRRAVNAMLSERHVGTRKDAFGAWPRRGDSRAIVESVRGEWGR